MTQRLFKETRLIRYGLILFFTILLVGGAEYLGFLSGMDHYFYDLSLRVRGERAPSPEILVVAIDEKSLSRLGRWPIRRYHYARLLKILAQARAVGFDIAFTEPSEDDAALSRAIREHGKVVLPAYLDHRLRISCPVPAFSASRVGHVHLDQDIDGIVRRVFHRMEYDGTEVPSFALCVYRLASGGENAPGLISQGCERSSGFRGISQRDPMAIHYYGASGSFPRLSLSDVIEGRWPSSFFLDKIVFVGVTSPGIEERILTPFDQDRNRMPGLEVHAHILNNLLDRSYIRPFDARYRWPLVVMSAVLGFLLFVRFRTVNGVVIWLSGLFLIPAVLFGILARCNVWIQPASFLFTFSLACLLAHVFNLERLKNLLQQAKEDWEESFNTIDDAIVLQDRDCRAVKANRAAQELYGTELMEMLNRRCLAFRTGTGDGSGPGEPGRSAGNHDGFIEEVFDPGLNRHLEIKSIPRLHRNGQWVGMVQVVRDVTQRIESERIQKTLQSQLIQAQKMEAIGALAGGIAHDFNNVLGAMLGFTELADLELPEGNPAKRKLSEVLKGGERAKKLIQHILAFSQGAEQEMVRVPVAPIIKEALNLLRSAIPTTIEIRQEIYSGGRILGDPTQIHQIVMNLCTNAYHAMRDEGGLLRIALHDEMIGPRLDIRGLAPGAYIRLSVEDTGHGMSPDIMERIFEPYFTTKEKGEGTGLGLSVVHGIVTNHKGHIRVRSEPGKGTQFDIFFPRIDGEGDRKEEETEPLPTGTERILLVDDEKVLLNIGRQMLQRLGYEVSTEESSLAALKTFRTDPHRFDLVITDMNMPGMTGERLALEMMGIRCDIPVILCTGFSEPMSEEKAQLLGIREFVMKPLVMRKLAQTVRRILDGHPS
ncbi:MAG: CHASE2 domain-containing protein [Deltaproteobacteria bacterium]|nr:CHASE2 domain-containing protein [Deltaproteobacteria bacterium]